MVPSGLMWSDTIGIPLLSFTLQTQSEIHDPPMQLLCTITVIFVGGNFCEKLEEALRIKFHGFKFRGALLYFFAHNVM